jgi:hypothetical protein
MGAQVEGKDPNLDIYFTIEKNLYFAGEIIQGEVHINCKKKSNYHNLSLMIKGVEHVEATVPSGHRNGQRGT